MKALASLRPGLLTVVRTKKDQQQASQVVNISSAASKL